MFMEALLLGVVAGIGILDGRIFGQMMFDRPLVTGLFVGLILGDVKQGIIIGAQLELVWMGIAGIGAATPPDVVTGGILGTAFAIISGQGVEMALTLAVPIAFLAQSLGVLVRMVNLVFAKRADACALKADFRGVTINMWIPVLLFFLSTAVPTFLAVLLGAGPVTSFVEMIPESIIDGLRVASGILPAVGFALLMDMLMSKNTSVYFFCGFLAMAYLGSGRFGLENGAGLNITAIALIGACVAVIINIVQSKNGSSNELKKTSDNLLEGEIDFE